MRKQILHHHRLLIWRRRNFLRLQHTALSSKQLGIKCKLQIVEWGDGLAKLTLVHWTNFANASQKIEFWGIYYAMNLSSLQHCNLSRRIFEALSKTKIKIFFAVDLCNLMIYNWIFSKCFNNLLCYSFKITSWSLIINAFKLLRIWNWNYD